MARATAKKTTDGVLTALKVGNGFVSLLSGLLAVVLILYSGYVLYDSFATEISAYSSSQDLLKYKPMALKTEEDSGVAGTLDTINPDYRSWLTVYFSTIDYPVMQGPDDLYYASHDVYKNVSLTGAIYLAAANSEDFSDSYNLIYGHHMDNGAMFGSLDKFLEEKYFRGHQNAIIETKSGIYDVTFFAVVKTDAYESQIYTVGNRAAEVIAFLTGSRENDVGVGTEVVIYDTKAARGATKVVALSTCADAATNGRLVIFGRMTPSKKAMPTATPTRRPYSSTSTPTPSPVPTVTLTVHYLEGEEEVFPTRIYPHTPGDPYYVVSPQYPGYDVDIEIVQGTINEDLVVYVHYVPRAYRLTIRYIFADGTEAAGTYTATVHTGEAYDVASPVIDGYTALRLRVSGTNPGRDEEYTVIYVPGTPDGLITLEDYEIATGLDSTCIQVGICFE